MISNATKCQCSTTSLAHYFVYSVCVSVNAAACTFIACLKADFFIRSVFTVFRLLFVYFVVCITRRANATPNTENCQFKLKYAGELTYKKIRDKQNR